MGRKDKEVSLKNGKDLPLGTRMRLARQQEGVSLTAIAKRLNYTKSHISSVENNVGRPSRELVEGYESVLHLRQGDLTSSQEKQDLGHRRTSILPDESKKPSIVRSVNNSGQYTDWGEAPHINRFYGREQELSCLESWIMKENCRLVAILGMGGIGKTTLTFKAAEQIRREFDYVYWRSLQNAPSIKDILDGAIQFFSSQEEIAIPLDVSDQISVLMSYMQKKRCLLILDNFESILQDRHRAGYYREGYEGYGSLLGRIGQSNNNSCLLVVSREKPREVAQLEGKASPIRSLTIGGLNLDDGREILKDKDLFGDGKDQDVLINRYSGNPLALMLVSVVIKELFQDDIAAFLQNGEAVFGDTYDLLEQQFLRLSKIEQAIMYWLAIERDPILFTELQDNFIYSGSRKELLEGTESLMRRAMIDRFGTGCFTMQSVILDYVTYKFIQQINHELDNENIDLFTTHALIKAQSKDFIRKNQIRLILEPITNHLLAVRDKEGIANKLKRVLSKLHQSEPQGQGFAAANILNLLTHLKSDVQGYDFSHLIVRGAYLDDVHLQNVNFADADLEKSTFTEDFGSILSVSYSPDGKHLVAGTATGEIRLWQDDRLIPMRTYQGHTDWVWSAVFNPDKTIIASSSEDRTVRLWSTDTNQCLMILEGHTDPVRSVAFSPDGKLLATASDDRTIRLWDVNTGQCIKELQGHKDWVRSVMFSPDGNLIVSGSGDQTIRIWEVSTGECLKTIKGHTNRVWSVAFSPDGNLIVSGSGDQTVRLWEVSSGLCLKTLQGHTNRVRSVVFSPDGKLLASGSENQMRLWEVSSGLCLRTLLGHTNRVWSVAFSPDGKLLASGSEDQTIRLWEVSSGLCLKTLQGHTNRTWSVAFSPDGKMLASGSENQTVCLWEVDSGLCLRTLQGHTNRVWSVAFSPDGKLLASGSEDQTIRLWEVSSGLCLRTLQGHSDPVRSVVFSSDGKLLASGSEDQTVRLWEVSSGQSLKVLHEASGLIWSTVFDSNRKLLAAGSEDHICVWDLNVGQLLKVLRGPSNWIRSIAFSPDGKLLVGTSSDQSLRVWKVSTWQILKTLQGHTNRIWSVTFSPDGKLLASGSGDQTIRLWRVSTGECLKILKGHTNRVWSVTFSPDGKLLASGSNDGTIRIWLSETGECIKTFGSEKPYEGMNISGTRGLTEAQRETLKALGAVEYN